MRPPHPPSPGATSQVGFLHDAPVSFLVQLALHLDPHVFAPTETCPPGCLYIVHRGLALYDGRLLGAGKVCAEDTFLPGLLSIGHVACPPHPNFLGATWQVWGEDVILTSKHLRSPHHARALTFLDVLAIQRSELFRIADHFRASEPTPYPSPPPIRAHPLSDPFPYPIPPPIRSHP